MKKRRKWTPEAGAALVKSWAYWHAREIVRAAELITKGGEVSRVTAA